MKIYISHSTGFEFRTELYEPIRDFEHASNKRLQFFLPHELSDAQQDIESLFPTLDLIIAEVSYSSTGQGIELGYAATLSIPIKCIHKKDSKYSNALTTISSDFYEYDNAIQMITVISELVKI